MKAFRFSMQRVLDVREALEDGAMTALAEELRRLEEHRQVLHSLVSRRHQMVEAAVDAAHDVSGSRKLRDLINCLDRLDLSLARQKERVHRAEDAVGKARENVAQAMRDVKQMDHLKKQERQNWKVLEKREEQTQHDEVSASAFIRRAAVERDGVF